MSERPGPNIDKVREVMDDRDAEIEEADPQEEEPAEEEE